jgi:hypothetical protein
MIKTNKLVCLFYNSFLTNIIQNTSIDEQDEHSRKKLMLPPGLIVKNALFLPLIIRNK